MPLPSPEEPKPLNDGDSPGRPISVLVIDDENDFCLLAKEMLGRLGRFEVTTALSVEDAVVLLERARYDVIVADYSLPGTDGIQLLKDLRAKGDTVPFIVFTGKGREDVAIDALNSGADFYLQKGGDVAASFANLSRMISQLVRIDVAERESKESVDGLLRQLKELDSIITQSPVIVATWGEGGGWPVGYVSSNVSQFGYTVEDFRSGRVSYLEVVHPDDLTRLQAELMKANDSGVPSCRFEYRILTKSGDVRWIDERMSVIRRDGVPIAWRGVLLDITERKAAERRIRDLAMIVDSSHDTIFRMDLEGKIVSWNKAAEESYGYSAADVLGTRADLLVPEALRDEFKLVMERVIEGEKVANYESVVVAKDGRSLDVSIMLSPVRDDSGSVIGLSVIGRDISARKNAERLLAESELKYRMLFDGANDAIYIADLEGHILDVNKTACEQTGYSRDELLGMNISEIDAKTEVDRGQRRLEAMRSQTSGYFETVHRAKDGREYPVEVSAKLIEYVGRPAVMGMARDVSERKMSEDALKAVMSSLEDLESIVTASPAVVFQWSYSPESGRHVQFVSNNVGQFGYTSSEMVSQVKGYEEFIHPDDRAPIASQISKYDAAGTEEFSLEYRMMTKDGSYRWVDDRTTVVAGDSRTSVRHRGIVMDITARRLAEDALKIANEKLNLLGSITRHDVANQIGIVLGAMSLLEEDTDASQRRSHIRMMQEAISKISQQLEFAGSYQKAGTRPAEWVHVRLDLAAAISAIELGNVKVENKVGNLEVWADPMFEKVLFNLIDNAMRHGGDLNTIRVFTERRGDDVVIVFEDDGVGVSPDEKEIIFGKGYGKNTGHGLFLCREILAITGMTIAEVGELGKGSRFEIFVPAGKHRG